MKIEFKNRFTPIEIDNSIFCCLLRITIRFNPNFTQNKEFCHPQFHSQMRSTKLGLWSDGTKLMLKTAPVSNGCCRDETGQN